MNIYNTAKEVLRENAANALAGLFRFMVDNGIPTLPPDNNDLAAILEQIAQIRENALCAADEQEVERMESTLRELQAAAKELM